jgi:hypothetical protein
MGYPELRLYGPDGFNESREKGVGIKGNGGGYWLEPLEFSVEIDFPMCCQESFEKPGPTDTRLSSCHGVNFWTVSLVLEWNFISEPILYCDDQGGLEIRWSASALAIFSDGAG